MMAKTLFGFEPLLAKELRALGAQNIREGIRQVSFEGDNGFMYKANFCLRTALKVLKPIAKSRVRNQQDLYRAVYDIAWPSLFEVDKSFALDTTMFSDLFNNSLFVTQKAKDALVDRFRREVGRRPDVDTRNADVRIQLHLRDDVLTVSLDSSGGSLHRRGYRQQTNLAPINEVLAAGLLKHSEYSEHFDLLDPMCGSGTFLIEAAMMACNIPPAINRNSFAFMNWRDFDAELWEVIREAALNKIRDCSASFVGYDKAPSAVAKAKENVKRANLEEYIRIEQRDFFKTQKEKSGKLQLVCNPPYGERLQIDGEEFYSKLGDTLKRSYPGTDAWVISSHFEGLKHVGLRPSRKIKVFNGSLEARWLKYEMYEGSKKAKKQNRT